MSQIPLLTESGSRVRGASKYVLPRVESRWAGRPRAKPTHRWPPAAAPMEVRLLSVRQPGMGHTNKLSIDGLSCEMVRTGPGIGSAHRPHCRPCLCLLQQPSPTDGRAVVLLNKADWPVPVSLDVPLKHLAVGSQARFSRSRSPPRCARHTLSHVAGRERVRPSAGLRQPLGLARREGG